MIVRALVPTLTVLLAAGASADENPRPQSPPGTVTLSLAEYDKLTDRAARPPKRAEQPPLASVLARVDAKVRVVGDHVRGTFTLEGEVFRTGPTKVALLSGATVLDARREGKTLPLLSEGGTHVAVLTGPGAFSVNADWGTTVVSEPGRASFVLPVPAAGSARVGIEVPGDQTDVRVEPGLVTKRTTVAGKTLVEATLDPGKPARVTWSAREGAAPATPREARFLSDVKTLVTVGEADLQLAALLDVTVLDGEPSRFEVALPPGFEVTATSGPTLDATAEEKGKLALVVREPAKRRHQFLLSLARATHEGFYPSDVVVPSIGGTQRETGEIVVTGLGTLELAATESGTARRMDGSEVSAPLRSLAKEALLAAFRYHRRANEGPGLKLDVTRFPSAAVLAAVAEQASVTTLATVEGRRLTEVTLRVRNHAQPFLKVGLPAGATLVSAEVAGEAAKPVQGSDGTRVPLLRAGFRPNGPYTVSFVYLEPGVPFAKKGEAEMVLPRMDIPVTLLEWELFLPDRTKVKRFEGNAIPGARPVLAGFAYGGVEGGVAGGVLGGVIGGVPSEPLALAPGQIGGKVTDDSGTPLPGATITLQGEATQTSTVSGGDGTYRLPGAPSGRYTITVTLPGFNPVRRAVNHEGSRASQADAHMRVGSLTETVEVTAETPQIDTRSSTQQMNIRPGVAAQSSMALGKRKDEPAQQAPSENVMNLQRRVAGVLPVRVDVPRAGASFHFVRPLVLDEETRVRFQYKTR